LRRCAVASLRRCAVASSHVCLAACLFVSPFTCFLPCFLRCFLLCFVPCFVPYVYRNPFSCFIRFSPVYASPRSPPPPRTHAYARLMNVRAWRMPVGTLMLGSRICMLNRFLAPAPTLHFFKDHGVTFSSGVRQATSRRTLVVSRRVTSHSSPDCTVSLHIPTHASGAGNILCWCCPSFKRCLEHVWPTWISGGANSCVC
jgi:hypothetical protein